MILDDTWEDGTRDDQNLPVESAWFTSSTGNGPLIAAPGVMTFRITGTSVLLLSYFTPFGDSPPVWLNVGDTMKATFEFVFGGIPTTSSSSQGFRFGLFNFADSTLNPKRISADGGFSSSSQGGNVQGYALFGKMYTSFIDNTAINIRKRTSLADNSLLGSSAVWTSLASGGDTSVFPGFSDGTPYALEFLLQRIGLDSMAVTISWSNQVNGAAISVSTVDTAATNFSFDGIAYRPQNTDQAPKTNYFHHARIEVLSVPVPPFILEQPRDIDVASGQNATFSPILNGTLPLVCQWFFNTNTPVPNGTNSNLTLENAGLDRAGVYRLDAVLRP